MADETPNKTARKTGAMPSMARAAGDAVGTAGRAVGATAKVGAGAAIGAAKGLARNVATPILQTAMLQQMPMIGVAFSAMKGIMDDIRSNMEQEDRFEQEQENFDRIGRIADNTGGTVDELDGLETILEGLGESIYEGVYEGVQDGISKLVGDTFTGVQDGFKDVLKDFADQGLGVDDLFSSLAEKFSGGSDAILEVLTDIQSMLEDFFYENRDDNSDNAFAKREAEMEGRVKTKTPENVKEAQGLLDQLGSGLSGILQALGIARAVGIVGAAIGGIVGLLTGPIIAGFQMILAGVAAIGAPVLAIIAAVAAVVAGVTYVAYKLGDGDIIEGFKIMGAWVIDTLKAIPGMVVDFFKSLPGRILAFVKDPFGEIERYQTALTENVTNAFNGFTDFFSEEIAAIDGFLEEYNLKDTLKSLLMMPLSMFNGIMGMADTLFPETMDAFKTAFAEKVDGLMAKAHEFIDFLTGIPERVTNFVKDQIRGIPLIGERLLGEAGNSDIMDRLESVVKFGQDKTDELISALPTFEPFDLKEAITDGFALLNRDPAMLTRGDAREKQTRQLADELTQLRRSVDDQRMEMKNNVVNTTMNSISNIANQFFPRGRVLNPNRVEYGH